MQSTLKFVARILHFNIIEVRSTVIFYSHHREEDYGAPHLMEELFYVLIYIDNTAPQLKILSVNDYPNNK